MVTISWERVGIDVLHMLVAYALAFPIGWNREREARSAGLRTFPLVAVASSGLATLAEGLSGGSADAISRMIQGLIAGIGFIGGGAILRGRQAISGTATAASIWNVGILGAATGFGYYHIAVFLSLLNFTTLQFLKRLKRDIRRSPDPEVPDTPCE